MADTKISGFTAGSTAAATDRIAAIRSPFGAGDDRYLTPVGIADYIRSVSNTFAAAVLSSGAASGIGYGAGSGGTVTQATSKTTGVTLNKVNGAITSNGAALAGFNGVTGYATASFTLTNSAIAVGDNVIVAHSSAGTAGAYDVTPNNIASGSCQISVTNRTAGSLSEAIVVTFSVIKGVTA